MLYGLRVWDSDGNERGFPFEYRTKWGARREARRWRRQGFIVAIDGFEISIGGIVTVEWVFS